MGSFDGIDVAKAHLDLATRPAGPAHAIPTTRPASPPWSPV